MSVLSQQHHNAMMAFEWSRQCRNLESRSTVPRQGPLLSHYLNLPGYAPYSMDYEPRETEHRWMARQTQTHACLTYPTIRCPLRRALLQSSRRDPAPNSATRPNGTSCEFLWSRKGL